MDVRVVADVFHGRRVQLQGGRELRDARAADGRSGRLAAAELRRDEHVDLVDLPGVEQAAQQPAATFDQHVRQPPPTQFGQQGIEPGRRCLAAADKHLAAGLFEPLPGGRRRRLAHGHQHRVVPGRAHQPALVG